MIRITRMSLRLYAGAFVLAITAPSGAGVTASFQGLGHLPSNLNQSTAFDISADGSTVVGWSDSTPTREAFSWTMSGGMVCLGSLLCLGLDSTAFAVSADGSVVVGKANGGAFFFNGATVFLPAAANSVAIGVSDNGQLVAGTNNSVAFRWNSVTGVLASLGALPGGTGESTTFDISADGLVVVGRSSITVGGLPSTTAFRWVDDGVGGGVMEELPPLPGGVVSDIAWATSADGSVVVGASFSSNVFPGNREAFRWVDCGNSGGGVMEALGDLPGGIFNSSATAVSADGSVVVGHANDANGFAAFIWDDKTHIMRNLQDVLVGAGLGTQLAGWRLLGGLGISADGTIIAGVGVNPNGFNEAWVVCLPRPAPCPADIDCSGAVDVLDLLALLGAWGPNPGHAADINGDCLVNVTDLLALLAAWGPC